jgi:hypothetical protein
MPWSGQTSVTGASAVPQRFQAYGQARAVVPVGGETSVMGTSAKFESGALPTPIETLKAKS